MLLNEVGQEQADWYLIAKDGNLTVKVSPGLCIGEDESGLLLLSPTSAQALVKFDVDAWGRLQIQPASQRFSLLSPQRNYCAHYRVEPYQGLSLWLPNNKLDLANDLHGITKQYDDLPVTLVHRPQSSPEPSVSEVSEAEPANGAFNQDNLAVDTLADEIFAVAPVLDIVVEEAGVPVEEIEAAMPAEEFQIPVLDSPIERIPEPDASETLITALPYGFEPKGFTTTQTVAIDVADFSRRHGRRSTSSRITTIACVILAGIAAGLLAAKLDLIEFLPAASEPRTAFNPATPRLVLLSEAVPVVAPVVSDTTSSTPEVAITPPETTPATPPSRPLEQPASAPSSASVYRTDLADATDLFHQGYITAPAQRNSVAILSRILEQDPNHPEATSLLKRCADRMIDAAVKADQHGLEFEARNLVEEVMAFYPGHPQALDLWQQWTHPPQNAQDA